MLNLTPTQKTKFVKKKIEDLYLNSLSRERIVAYALVHKGITEEEFLKMQEELPIDKPTIVGIANEIRDIERKENEQTTTQKS